jgi:hypothetical protein
MASEPTPEEVSERLLEAVRRYVKYIPHPVSFDDGA